MIEMGRYRNLFVALDELKARGDTDLNVVEVGTHVGLRAVALFRHWRQIAGEDADGSYVGFDHWDGLPQKQHKLEFFGKRKLATRKNTETFLRARGVRAKVFGGDPVEAITRFVAAEPESRSDRWNLIIVGGGHRLQTLVDLWESIDTLIGPRTIVLYDNYYEWRTDIGCRQLMLYLEKDGGYVPSVLDPADELYDYEVVVRMARVERKK